MWVESFILFSQLSGMYEECKSQNLITPQELNRTAINCIDPYLNVYLLFPLFQQICKQYGQYDNPTLGYNRWRFDQDDLVQ